MRELHFTHDPDTGAVSYVVVYDYGAERRRVRATGRYTNLGDQPKLTVTREEDFGGDVFDSFDRHSYIQPRHRGGIDFKATFNVLETVIEPADQGDQPRTVSGGEQGDNPEEQRG